VNLPHPQEFLTLQEVVAAARANLAPGPWSYLVGGAETETTVRRNRQALDSLAFRPRVLVYASILAAIVIGAAIGLYVRVPLKVDVIRDRAAIAREVEGGRIENVYRLQIMNTAETRRTFEISAAGLPTLEIAGAAKVELEGTASRMIPVRLRVQPGAAAAGTHRIEFVVSAVGAEDVSVREKSVFIIR